MRSGSSVSTHHHHYALNTGTSDEELLCASLMKNSREIKAYFNTFSERNWIKLLQYLVLIGIRTVNKRSGLHSSLETIRDIADSITNNTNNTPSQQSQQNQQPQQQPYDQRSSYNNNNNGFNNNNNGFNNNNNNGFNNNNGYNNNNRQQQQQDYDDNYENDEARFKPSSRWRKGERQGVNLKSNNNNNGFNNNNNQYSSRENDYFTEKPNNMIPSSPNKGQQSNRNQPSYQQQQNNNNPYSNGSYDDSPTLRYDAPQQPPPQQRPYYNNGNPHQQQAIPNVHDYFNPYQNAYPAQYSPHQVIPQPTFVHYPSYPSHPLSSPVIHHHINPPQPHIPPQQPQQYSQPPLQLNQLNQFNQIPSISPSSQTPSQVTTPRGRSDSDVVTMNEQVNIPSKRPQKITIEEEPIIHEEENPKSIAWSTNMTSPSKKKKGITPKKDTKKIPLKKSQSTRHSSVPPKFGIESKIKDQIQMDKRTNPHKGNFEPVLVTSKNEETVIGDYEITPDSNNIENLNISKIDSFKPPIPKEKPIYDQEDETIPQKQDNYVVSKPPRQARFSSTPNKQEIQQPKEEVIPPPLQTKLRQPPSTNQSINTNAPNSNNNVNNNIGSNTTGSGYASQYSNRSSQQNLIPRSNSNQNVIPERVPERPRPIITPIPTEKINQERVQSLNNRMPEKPIMDIPRSDPIRQSQLQQQIPQKQQPQPQQQPAQRQSQQPPIVKTPVRNVPSKRLEELLYQKSKPIESPRAENHGGSVLSIVENFMLDPNMKDFY